jgi:hypothetical protein
MKDKTRAFMAGVIDGDGHIGIQKHPYFSPSIQFVNESKPLMNWAVLHFGGSVRKENIPSGKEFYRWVLYGKKAQKQFIADIAPYLIVKRTQTEVLSRFLDLDSGDYDVEKRNSLFLEVRAARASSSVETDTQNRLDFFTNKQLLSAYAAGMIDTDGHIACRRVQSGSQMGAFRSRIEVVNIHQPLLHHLKREFGGSVYLKNDTATRAKYPRYRWVLSNKNEQEKALLGIIPYLIVKKDRANNMLIEVRKRLKIQSDLHSNMQSAPAEMLIA